MIYRNVMEELVEEVYEDMKPYADCCTCELCHADIVACALNMLPPKYAATRAGVSLSKASQLRSQALADIQTALAKAMQIVKEHPRHDRDD